MNPHRSPNVYGKSAPLKDTLPARLQEETSEGDQDFIQQSPQTKKLTPMRTRNDS